MLCTSEGVKNTSEVRQYEKEVRDFIEKNATDITDINVLESLMVKELENLRKRIRGESNDEVALEIHAFENESPDENLDLIENLLSSIGNEETKEMMLDEFEEKTQKENIDNRDELNKKNASILKKSSGYKPEVLAMEEKLVIGRKPIADFLTNECVALQLLTKKRAAAWVHKMSGRVQTEVEAEIVAELSENLHQYVKKHIRKTKKNNPWSTPRLQDDLRLDIKSVKTVRGVLILSNQIRHEIKVYEVNSRPSILKRLFKK